MSCLDERCSGCFSHGNESCELEYELPGKQCPCFTCLVKVTCDQLCSECKDYIGLHMRTGAWL